jgi:hypothetical protein
VGLPVVESGGLVTTVATEGKLDAIDQLLFGEGKEIARHNLVSTFSSAGGGESPAGTALTLILDGGHGTESAPVDGGSVGGTVNGLGGFLVVAVVHVGHVAEHGGELRSSHVGELVVANFVVNLLSVLNLDASISGSEESLTEVVFINGLVLLGVHDDVLEEFLLDLVSGDSDGEGSGNESFHLSFLFFRRK